MRILFAHSKNFSLITNDFFRKSQLFKKYDSKHYLFQMYKDLGEISEYKYPFGN